MSDYILEFNNVTKEFPGVLALNDVSFKVRRGTIHAICGENGAGKSTLMKVLAGIYPHESYSGSINYNGEELNFTVDSIQQAIEKGIAIVHQELALIPQITVGENIYLGREPAVKGIINWNKLFNDTKLLLEKHNLDIPFAAITGDLSVGKQQMVEIAKVLSENAQVLILDEPTSALTDSEVDTLMEILDNLRNQGTTCIYISHKLEEVFRIADDITVFRDGAVVGSKPTSEVDNEKIIAMMVGREMTERFPPSTRMPSETLMEVRNWTVDSTEHHGWKAVDNVSFSLRKGEILGIAGLMGSGRSELVLSLFGEYGKNREGSITIEGRQVQNRSAREAIKNGISLVPEDRKRMGLVVEQSILKNISLPNLDRFASFLSINKHLEIQECETIAKDMAVKTPTLHALVSSLSGGNQQKVVIAKWLMSSPKILILDEPTRGIDVGAKFEIYKLMNDLTSQGISILMVSSELPEILGMSDRIMVMHEGKLGGIIDRSEATQENIMAMATGLN
ncbi:sugar ABC transporter ATP-binding protein [Desulfopila sp. IMCC35008]|uniref:sugar ABC transporter ATP-binding protein n=1 Tax=Desulfopila sp. IMCC35008 TaxID=2653858 RepID=UPI0013D88F9F|nr:ATP-binding cassette domain-containing protein [Desulfopila sp. IMCC35008]